MPQDTHKLDKNGRLVYFGQQPDLCPAKLGLQAYLQIGLQILGREDLGKLMRVHLARLLPGGRIRVHRDRGRYAAQVEQHRLTHGFSSQSQGQCYQLSNG